MLPIFTVGNAYVAYIHSGCTVEAAAQRVGYTQCIRYSAQHDFPVYGTLPSFPFPPYASLTSLVRF